MKETRKKSEKELEPKQRRFISEYLKDPNATQAAIRAGYSEKTARSIGSENLSKPAIRNEIDRKLNALNVTADRVIAELGKLAFSDLKDLYTPAGALKPIHEWPEDARRAVSGVDVEEVYEGFGREKELKGELKKIRLWSKPQALEILAKHFKLLTEKVEHSGSVTLEQLLGASHESK